MSKPDALKLADELEAACPFKESAEKMAAAELRRLHAETTNQKDWLVEWRKWEAEAKRLTLENEALRKDAERYRLLKKNSATYPSLKVPIQLIAQETWASQFDGYRAHLDAAIDAMKEASHG